MKWIAGVITSSLALATAALTIRPASHDFGDQGVNLPGNYTTFRVTLPPGAGPGDTLDARIEGPDADGFLIETGKTSGTNPSYHSDCIDPTWSNGNCYWVVEFRPTSVGPKTATLIVRATAKGRQVVEEGRAALRGNGVAGCRYELVPCNYAHFYTGTFEIHSLQTTVPNGAPSYSVGRNEEFITIHVDKGKAWCRGFVHDTTTSLSNGRVDGWSVTEGMYDGEGLFAVEFENDENGRLAYRISYACPHWQGSNHGESISYGPDGAIVVPTSYLVPFEPADWRDASEGEFARIRAIGDDLDGTEKIPNDDEAAGPGVTTGWITFKWSLKVSQ